MKKYSVLLVDDEEDVVEAIVQKIDWEALGYSLAVWKPWKLQKKSKWMWYLRI